MPLRHIDISKISAWSWQNSPKSCQKHVLLQAKRSTLGSLKWLLLRQLKLAQVTRDTEGKNRKAIFKLQSSLQSAAIFNHFKYRFLDPSDSDLLPNKPFLSLCASAIKSVIQIHGVLIYLLLWSYFPPICHQGEKKKIKTSLMKLYYFF